MCEIPEAVPVPAPPIAIPTDAAAIAGGIPYREAGGSIPCFESAGARHLGTGWLNAGRNSRQVHGHQRTAFGAAGCGHFPAVSFD